jgi:hypothetical protein
MRFWLEPPPLVGCLAVHLSRWRRGCTRVLGVYCVLGVRECVLVSMLPRSGEVCASASFTRKKCALNLLACGVLPRVVSTLFTSPRVRWASSLLIFTHCHMGQHTKIENTS